MIKLGKIKDLYIFFKKKINLYRISNFLKDALPNKDKPGSSSNKYMLRIVDNFYKKDKIFLKIQIKNTRATFDIDIPSLLTSQSILNKLDPFFLFEIGYIFKKDERFLTKKSINIAAAGFLEKIKIFIKKNLINKLLTPHNNKKYSLRIEKYHIIDKNIFIILSILSSSLNFEIPLNELIKDFTLLSSIEPHDLIRIGYSIREEELNHKIPLLIFE